MNILNKKNRGLTLIETLVAITILLMSTVMPMVIYSNSIMNSIYASEQITATYLAQEGLELIKYDVYTELNQNAANGTNNWFDSLPNCNGNGLGNTCTIDVTDGSICNGASCDTKLYVDSNSNLYTHTSFGNKQTKFSRIVKFVSNPPKEAARISAVVKWVSAGKNRSVTIDGFMTKWR